MVAPSPYLSAGDYLHPRYPATLEAAVQSGFAAAEKLMLDLQVE